FVSSDCATHRTLHSFPTRRSSDLVEERDELEKRRASLDLPLAAHRGVGLLLLDEIPLVHGDDERGALLPRIVGDLQVLHMHAVRSEEHTSELQSRFDLVCRLLLEK